MNVFEFHIDESGDFERDLNPKGSGHSSHCRIVGGIIVPPELAARRDQFRPEFQEILTKYFPGKTRITDIHLMELDAVQQKEARQELLTILKEKMPEAQLAFVYGTEDLNEDTSPLGAHLYRNMLIGLIRTIIYFHPSFAPDSSFSIRLAHRRVPYPFGFDRNLAGQGYLKLREVGGKTWFTAITEADLKSILMNLRDSVRLKKKVETEYLMKTYAEWDDPFMVLADAVCNTMLGIVSNAKMRRLGGAIRGNFGPNSVVYYASNEYEFPEELLTMFQRQKFGDFLKMYHTSFRRRDPEHADTDRLLLPPAVSTAIKNLSNSETLELNECATIVSLVDEIYDKLRYDLYAEVPRLLRILDARLQRVVAAPPDADWDSVAYIYFNNLLIRANHTGDFINGPIYARNADLLFKRSAHKTVDQIRAHHEFLNRCSVMDSNEFAFQRAMRKLEPVRNTELAINKVLGDPCNEILGKVLGSLGQNLAFLGRHEEAGKTFEDARIHLGQTDTRQVSYMSHLALEITPPDREMYERELPLLFKETFEDQKFPGFSRLVDICLSDLNNQGFNLHLLLKGMSIFLKSDEQKPLLVTIDAAITPHKFRRFVHPWALIYSLMGAALSRFPDQHENAILYWRTTQNFTNKKSELTLIMICHAARAAEALFHLANDQRDDAIKLLKEIAATFIELQDTGKACGIFNPRQLADPDGQHCSGWFDEVGNRFVNLKNDAVIDDLRDVCDQFLKRFTFNYW